MSFQKIKISALIVVVGISSLLPVGLVFAQVGGVGPVPVEDLDTHAKIDAVSEGINGTKGSKFGGINQVSDVIAGVRKKLGQVSVECVDKIEKISSLGQAAFLQSLGSTNFGLIGGSEIEAVLNTTQAKNLKDAFFCVDTYVKLLIDANSTHLKGSEDLDREQQTFSGLRDVLSKRVDDMNARASASWKDVLKAVMVRIILNLNKNLTTTMVNKMVDKYKISDYLKYGDAVASQVYSMKYINENFQGDARQQMIVRSLLQSDALPERVKTAQAFATSKAQEYLGAACGVTATPSFNQDLTSYMNCLAAYGSKDANPNYHFDQGIGQAQAAASSGRASATAEISQGNGFAPPRDCKGSLAVQKEIDARFDKAAKEKTVAMETVAKLKNALSVTPPRTTQEEYNKALQALDQATANLKQLEKQSDSAIIDICEAIVSPANFVSTSINNFLKQHIDQGSQLKNDNLPFYASFLADFTSNFLTNILTGGKSTSQVLKEAGTAGLNSALGGLNPGTGTTPNPQPTPPSPGGTTPPAPTSYPTIYAVASGSNTRTTDLVTGQQYTIFVEFSKITPKPYSIAIQFAGATGGFARDLTPAEIQSNIVQFPFTAPASPFRLDATFYERVANGDGREIGTWQESFGVRAVQGLSIVLPRGPELSLR